MFFVRRNAPRQRGVPDPAQFRDKAGFFQFALDTVFTQWYIVNMAEAKPANKRKEEYEMTPIAKAKADEFYTAENGYEFNGTPVNVLGQDGDRYYVEFGNGRKQWLPALNVRIKKIRKDGKWVKA